VANTQTLLSLIGRVLPELCLAFNRFRSFCGTATEEGALRTIYRALPSVNFSGRVLAEFPTESQSCRSAESVGAILATRSACSRYLEQRSIHFGGKT
jgi:hypothetical protein